MAIFLINANSNSQILEWGYRLGGSNDDNCHDIEIDNQENIYITGGICNSVNFNLKGGSNIISAYGPDQSDIFVAKYNIARDLIIAFVLKGTAWDYATDIEIDSLRNIYISGSYSGTIDFDPDQDDYNLNSNTPMFFVAKYDSVGNFQWAKNISTLKEQWRIIRSPQLFIDEKSNLYMSTPDTLCKIDKNGNILWSNTTTGLAVFDRKCNFYVSSIAWFNYFPVAETNDTIFLSKIDTSGIEIFTEEIILNPSKRIVGSLTYDKSGNLIIYGEFWGNCTFNGNDHSITLTNDRMECCGSECSVLCPSSIEYFAKFDTAGNIIWVYDLDLSSRPKILETTNDGTIFMLGFLNFSIDFDPSEKIAQLSNSGYGHFIAKYDKSFNFVAASDFMGSSYNESINDFKVSDDSTAIMCGYFRGTMDLDLSSNYYSLSSYGAEDIFLAKYLKFDVQDNTYTSVQITNQTENIKIFPNPARSAFWLENLGKYKIDNISIYNLEGHKVKSIENYDPDSSIDISTLSRGIYIIQLRLRNKILIDKLIKY